MFMKSYKKLNKHKRGFTLAETVLALAVISITSVGTLSLILASQRATPSAAQKQQAQLFATDIVHCFRVSDTDTSLESFKSNVEFALGKEIADINTFALDKELTANVEINDNTVKVTVTKDGKEVAKLSFTKGDFN